MSWNDHDHRGEYADAGHTHYDYADERHRHYDLERDSESARHGVDELRAEVRDLRDQLDEALDRIAALEKQTPEALQLQLETDQAAADLAATGYVEGLSEECRTRWHERCPVEVRCDCYCHVAGEDQAVEPEPEEYNPGPEVDDEGGMSEYRYILPEDYERGQS